jgi:hypothetical protein
VRLASVMGDGNNTNGMKCSGATVGDIKSTKEGTFTVQQPSVGKISVSDEPFQLFILLKPHLR